MQKKILTAIIFMGIVLSFVSVFSIKCIAPTPNIPVVFTATTISKTQIDLAWTMGEKADTTIIERNTSGVTTWVRGAGTQIYNGSLLFYSDTGLIEGTTYYYQAWSWNQTDNMYSSNSANRFNTTFTNQPPLFGLPSPSDGSTNNPLSLTWSIPINDPEGDTFTWIIRCSNGQVTGSSGASDGTKSLALSGLAYSTTYTVLVGANDLGSGLNTSGSYTFTTQANVNNNPPVCEMPSPANGSTGNPLNLTWNILINDPDGNTFTWIIQCSNGQTNDGYDASNGIKSLTLSDLTYSTTYTVWVNATDPAPAGSKLDTRRWYTFTTKGNNPPVLGNPSPGNGSTGNLLSLPWSIPINDLEGDQFSWTIKCSNGQTSGLITGASNGTKSLALSGLTYSTTYTVWVNLTDPAGIGIYSQNWYTFTTKSSSSGGDGEEPPVEPENTKPIADVSAGEPYQGFVDSTILFNGSRSYDPDGTITTWFWVFGDNSSGTGKTIAHTYSKAGTYTITLTVTDNKSATNFDTTTCVITQPNRPPTKPIITGPTNGTKNTIYNFSAVSQDADDDAILYTFNWDDGISLPRSSGFLPDGLVFTVNHSWTAVGRYEVTVTVTDNQTQSSSNITVYIDTKQIGTIGYLFDDNSDGIYDAFYSDSSKRITTIQNQNGSYYIDSDGDNEWDFTFSPTNELAKYKESPPDIQLFFVIGVIVLVSIWAILMSLWIRKTKKHN